MPPKLPGFLSGGSAPDESSGDSARKAPEERKLYPADRLALARKKAISTNITIRMPVFELERARRQAEQKGLRYQTYIKMLLHDALERAET